LKNFNVETPKPLRDKRLEKKLSKGHTASSMALGLNRIEEVGQPLGLSFIAATRTASPRLG
jgi:hypothetical protein